MLGYRMDKSHMFKDNNECTLDEIKKYYDALVEDKQRKVDGYKEMIRRIEEIDIPKIVETKNEHINSFKKGNKLGGYRVLVYEWADEYPPVYTIHLGEVCELDEFFVPEDRFDFMNTVNKLADLGLSFKTKNEAESYLKNNKK